MKTLLYCLVLLFSLIASAINDQNYVGVSMEERKKMSLRDIEKSPLVVDGIIRKADCFYGTDSINIFTKIEVEVLQVLKGNLDTDRLELIVPGGRIGLDNQHDVHNPMSLFLENHYVFLLKECTYRYLKKNHSYYQLFKNHRSSFARSRRENLSLDGWYGFHEVVFRTDLEFDHFLKKALKNKNKYMQK